MLRDQELLLLGVPWKEPVLMLPNQKGAALSVASSWITGGFIPCAV